MTDPTARETPRNRPRQPQCPICNGFIRHGAERCSRCHSVFVMDDVPAALTPTARETPDLPVITASTSGTTPSENVLHVLAATPEPAPLADEALSAAAADSGHVAAPTPACPWSWPTG